MKTASLFQSCVLHLSFRLYYFSLNNDYPPFLQIVHYTISLHGSATIVGKFKLETVWEIKYTDHGPRSCSREFQFSCCLHNGEYHYLVEGHKVFEYQTETDLLNRLVT